MKEIMEDMIETEVVKEKEEGIMEENKREAEMIVQDTTLNKGIIIITERGIIEIGMVEEKEISMETESEIE